MKIEEIMKKIEGNVPMGVKKFAVSGALVAGLLAGCGRTVDTNQTTTPAPTTSIETTVDNPEVDAPVIDETNPGEVTDKPGTTVVDTPVIETPAFVQTGDNEYTIYVDCADNSAAPEVQTIELDDTLGSIAGNSEEFGISRNLLTAVMAHGVKTDYTNAAQINYDVYMNQTITANSLIEGEISFVINDRSVSFNSGMVHDLRYGTEDPIPPMSYCVCAMLLQNSLVNTNGNITCALARYNMGPEAWDQVMEECMNATGLTAEEIYKAGDAKFVMSYDTLGLGDPDYANEVLSYVDGPITFANIDPNGNVGISSTYIIEEAKAYGQR